MAATAGSGAGAPAGADEGAVGAAGVATGGAADGAAGGFGWRRPLQQVFRGATQQAVESFGGSRGHRRDEGRDREHPGGRDQANRP
jgi:hypothetical protein